MRCGAAGSRVCSSTHPQVRTLPGPAAAAGNVAAMLLIAIAAGAVLDVQWSLPLFTAKIVIVTAQLY